MNPDIEWDIDGLAEILGDDEVSNLLSSPASGEKVDNNRYISILMFPIY